MKKRIVIAGAVIVWVVCGVLGDGAFVADFHHRYPGQDSIRRLVGEGMIVGIVGPMGLFAAASFTGFFEHGFCWTEDGCAVERKIPKETSDPCVRIDAEGTAHVSADIECWETKPFKSDQ